MSSKLKITVMAGGPGSEREVSLRSGVGVAKALRSLGPWRQGEFVHNSLHLCAQERKVLFDHQPYGLWIDTEVRMDESVARSRNLTPRHAGFAVGERLAQVLDCFADDFELPYDRALRLAVGHEGALAKSQRSFPWRYDTGYLYGVST